MTNVADIADLRRQRYNAVVSYVHKPHTDLMIMRVRPDFSRPRHQPGQYGTLGLGAWEPRFPGCQDEDLKPGDESKVIRRAYSLSCSILDDSGELYDMRGVDWVEFYVVLVRETGDPNHPPALTPRLFMLREGDRLQLGEKITGHFTLEGVQPDDAVVFLSTGTGEAPHNYMIWQLLKDGHQGPIVSACCVRYKRDLAYLPVQEQLMARYPKYKYLSLTTREAVNSGQKVYIQDLIQSGQLEEHLGRPLDPAAAHVYLCGNPKMIGVPEKDKATGRRQYPETLGVIEILEKRGFTCDNPAAKHRGSIHFEEYW